MYPVLGRSLKKSSTQPGWMWLEEGTPVACPSPSPAVPWAARAPALTLATDQALAPVHVRVLARATQLTPIPTYVKPNVPARNRVTSQTSVKAQGHVMAQGRDPDRAQLQDNAQALTRDPPFLHCLTVSSLKDHPSPLFLMLSTPPLLVFLPSLTSWALCRCILPECCWCATAAWPINS